MSDEDKKRPNLLKKVYKKGNEEVEVEIEPGSDAISDQIAGQIMNLADKIENKLCLLGGQFIVTEVDIEIGAEFVVSETSNKGILVSFKGTKEEQVIGTKIRFTGVRTSQ